MSFTSYDSQYLRDMVEILKDIHHSLQDISMNIEHLAEGKIVECPSLKREGCGGDGIIKLKRFNLGHDTWLSDEEIPQCAECDPEEYGLTRKPKKRLKNDQKEDI